MVAPASTEPPFGTAPSMPPARVLRFVPLTKIPPRRGQKRLAVQLQAAHPDWTAAKCRAIARLRITADLLRALPSFAA